MKDNIKALERMSETYKNECSSINTQELRKIIEP